MKPGLLQAIALLVFCSAGAGGASAQQDPDPFVGHFRHSEFEIVLSPTEGEYEGWIELRVRGERFAVHAKEVNDKLEGYFIMDGGRFTFTATSYDNGLVFMMPLARTASDARRSFGQWVKQRCRARRVENDHRGLR